MGQWLDICERQCKTNDDQSDKEMLDEILVAMVIAAIDNTRARTCARVCVRVCVQRFTRLCFVAHPKHALGSDRLAGASRE